MSLKMLTLQALQNHTLPLLLQGVKRRSHHLCFCPASTSLWTLSSSLDPPGLCTSGQWQWINQVLLLKSLSSLRSRERRSHGSCKNINSTLVCTLVAFKEFRMTLACSSMRSHCSMPKDLMRCFCHMLAFHSLSTPWILSSSRPRLYLHRF